MKFKPGDTVFVLNGPFINEEKVFSAVTENEKTFYYLEHYQYSVGEDKVFETYTEALEAKRKLE